MKDIIANSSLSQKKLPTRNGFGEGLSELGALDSNVVVLSADLSESTRAQEFQKRFPERFFQVGVAEQNLMGVAAGLALSGKVPFVCSYAAFSPGRNWDQLRVSVCYSKANVKIIGGHTGLSVGPDGATHQALEDIAMTRCLPNLTVVYPCDALQARKATIAIGQVNGPVYLRTSREATPVVTTEETPFKLGKAQIFRSGKDVTVISTGPMIVAALEAAAELEKRGVSAEVIDLHTIKPLDVSAVIASLKKTGCAVTVEDHQVFGGMGSAVAECAAENFPVPLEMVGVKDQFGQSGTAVELLAAYGLTAKGLIQAVHRVLRRKHVLHSSSR